MRTGERASSDVAAGWRSEWHAPSCVVDPTCVETEKAAINVKVLLTHQIMSHTCHLPRPDFQPSPRVTMCQANCSGVIGAVLVELDEEIKEEMPMFELQ